VGVATSGKTISYGLLLLSNSGGVTMLMRGMMLGSAFTRRVASRSGFGDGAVVRDLDAVQVVRLVVVEIRQREGQRVVVRRFVVIDRVTVRG
jgi:hypothetical protein